MSGSALAQEVTHKRVLLVHSYGTAFAPFETFASGLQKELKRLSPTPVEFFEASLETARFAQTKTEGPLADYLDALFRESRIDLVVTIGGPAARFCLAHRDRLFPSTPLLVAAIATRVWNDARPPIHSAAVTVTFDLAAVVETILRVLPTTTDVVAVFGETNMGRYWLDEVKREFEPYADRVRFTWLHDLSMEELEEHVSALGPNTVIFYGGVTIDAAGVPLEHDEALYRLRDVATAPIFGLYDAELSRGIVGGPLISLTEGSRRAATSALQLLNGEAPENVQAEPFTAGPPVFNFLELERWNVPEERLPPGSTVLFRPRSFWGRHRGPLFLAASVLGLETVLVMGLLLQRARRRRAEQEANALSRRLLTAHEDERGRLGRELHDDLSQRLVRLAIDAAHVEKVLEASPDEALARSMREDASRLSEDVHALSYQLHPSVLDDLGLAEALETECELFGRRESVPAQLHTNGAPTDLEPERALCLFRIAQEALRNVARHAHASRVDLSLRGVNRRVEMEVEDDGVGFDAKRKPDHPCLGLASMRERARLVGGEVSIESTPGRGTTVRAWVPKTGDA